MNTHGGQLKGWVGQIKSIPSFRTRSLKTVSGYFSCNPVAVSVSRLSSGWRLHLQYGPQAHFVFPSEPITRTVPWLPTLARALNPAAYKYIIQILFVYDIIKRVYSLNIIHI